MSKRNNKKNKDESDDESYIEDDIIDESEDIEDIITPDENDNSNEEDSECLIDTLIEEEDDEDNIQNDFEGTNNKIIVKKEDRISANRLIRYEMVRILGERTKQLTKGAKPMIKNFQHLSYEKIAEEELKNFMIPYKIRRPLPNGKYEIWSLDELSIDHLLTLLEE